MISGWVVAEKKQKDVAALDRASRVLQHHFRGYKCRQHITRAILCMGSINTEPTVGTIQVLHLFRILRSDSVGARDANDFALLDAILLRVESKQERGFFSLMSRERRYEIYQGLQLLLLDPDVPLFMQGDHSNETFYFILSGRVWVLVDGYQVVELGYGATFGERVLTEGESSEPKLRTAGIVASEECLLVTITRAAYLRVTGTLAAQVVHVLQVPEDKRSKSQLACLAEMISDCEFFKTLQFSNLILAEVRRYSYPCLAATATTHSASLVATTAPADVEPCRASCCCIVDLSRRHVPQIAQERTPL